MPEPTSQLDFLAELARYRALIAPALQAALPQREPRKHLYGLLDEHMQRSGKGLRPALCLATCTAFGGDERQALQPAAALELLHNAFLIHDDIEDGSEFRRDQPTMYLQHGVPLAINAGDALQALSLQLVRRSSLELGPRTTWRLSAEFDHMLLESLEGQALELGWIRDNRCDVAEQDYLEMTLKKTCWYSFIHPCRIGALIAQPDLTQLERFDRFGFLAGAAFQIQDDVLNLVGEQHSYGKEIGGDLWEGKRTLILAHLVKQLDARDRQRMESILSKPRSARLPREVAWLSTQIVRHGSLEYARAVAEQFASAASAEFERAFAEAPENAAKLFLRAFVNYLVARQV
ncbi:MAG: hypothetical protein RL701_1454 [Pseudomonadota bacterium]|jgi:geranylgeranyl diphosphate synthase type II